MEAPCPGGALSQGSLSQGLTVLRGSLSRGFPVSGAPCHTGCRDGPKEGSSTVA